MVTKHGVIKRTEGTAFTKIRSTGIRALTLREDDSLVFCSLSSGNDYIVIATALGQGIRFKEGEVRVMGRTAAGVMGIRLYENDFVVGMEVVRDEQDILFVTERGYGKRVRVADFRVTHRGGYGVRTIPTEERNGMVIGLAVVDDMSTALLIDTQGKIIRLSPKEIRTMGRQAKGVRLIRLEEDRVLAALAVIQSVDGENGNNGNGDGTVVADEVAAAALKDEEADTAPEGSLTMAVPGAAIAEVEKPTLRADEEEEEDEDEDWDEDEDEDDEDLEDEDEDDEDLEDDDEEDEVVSTSTFIR